MASSSLLPILFFSCFQLFFMNISHARTSDSLNGGVFPVSKDILTRQYVTQIHRANSPVPIRLVVDLGGPFLWLNCGFGHQSSSGHLIPGCSTDCAKAKAHHQIESKNPCFSGNSTTCALHLQNEVAGLTTSGYLVEGVVAVGSIDSLKVGGISFVETVLFACAPTFLLQGLASGSQGVLGLGRAQISLPSQLSAKTGKPRRLTVCLSPSDGVVSTSSAEEVFGTEVSSSLVYTPLNANPRGNYAINVKSIKINGEKLRIDIPLFAELSTVVPYMTMESSIYAAFIKAYAKASDETKMVEAMAPFGVCFRMTRHVGSENPVVEMGLQSEMVKWRMRGRNLMVDVGGGVGCLGVVDGGTSQGSPIVMGGLQMEDMVLDFDLGNWVMGFGQRSCSDFEPDSVLEDAS